MWITKNTTKKKEGRAKREKPAKWHPKGPNKPLAQKEGEKKL